MSKRWIGHIVLITIVLGAMIVTGLLARGETTQSTYLPFVATNRPSVTVLIDHDTTMVTAYVLPGTQRILVGYIDRKYGNLFHVTEDMGSNLVEIPMTQAQFAALQPAFVVPGDKQANGSFAVTGNILHVYVCTRDVDDPTGPFKLKRLDMLIPPQPQP